MEVYCPESLTPQNVLNAKSGPDRAMGYCRPVSNFNKGKKSEFYERKYFTEQTAVNHLCDHKD